MHCRAYSRNLWKSIRAKIRLKRTLKFQILGGIQWNRKLISGRYLLLVQKCDAAELKIHVEIRRKRCYEIGLRLFANSLIRTSSVLSARTV